MQETSEPAEQPAGASGGTALDALRPLLRSELAELTAYVPHDPPGIQVKLDANEAPGPVPVAVREAALRGIASIALERYPDPRALRLKEALAKRTGARPEDLFVGTGSDEVIALLSLAFARPRTRGGTIRVMAPTPTFVMYRITGRAHGLAPFEVPLDASWDLDVGAMQRGLEMMQPNLVFVASPNNPTGNLMSEDRLAALARSASSSLFIIDEAYIDYAGPGASRRGWRAQHGHVGILRTLSKIGLAALRIGWLEADTGLVRELDKVRQPFNVSAASQIAAATVLEDAWDEIQREIARVAQARDVLAAEIARLDGFEVTPSAANFVWVKTPGPAQDVFDHLVRDGILVRSFHAAGGRLGRQLRITIGTDADHERLLASLQRFTPQAGRRV